MTDINEHCQNCGNYDQHKCAEKSSGQTKCKDFITWTDRLSEARTTVEKCNQFFFAIVSIAILLVVVSAIKHFS